MSNMIQAAREQVAALTQAAYEKAAAEGLLPAGAEVKATIEIPKDVTHGDYASSFAMAGAKALRRAPRQIAEVIVSHLDLAGTFFDKVEIAGPGFLNFTLGSKWYGGVLADIQAEGETYGAVDEGRSEKVMVEFVSANPTGPMHIGNARGGVLGDALAGPGRGSCRCFVSDRQEDFSRLASTFLGWDVAQAVEQVDISQY